MKLKTLDTLDFSGKRVLLRIDVNAAVVKGKILDSPRFAAAAETLKELMKKKTKIVVLTHQGRKGGKDYLSSLEQHASILSKYIGNPVNYVDDVFGMKTRNVIKNLQEGEIILLKNIRAYNDEFDIKKKYNRYKEFCSIFDIFVNDAFSVSHRAQGSIMLPPRFLPSCIGRSFEKEMHALNHFRSQKDGTKAFLLGGEKVEDYIPIFEVLKDKDSKVLASGVLGNLFIVAKGIDLGYENRWLKKKGYFALMPILKKILRAYKKQIILPIDFALKGNERKEVLLVDAPFNNKIYDVGRKSVALFKRELKNVDVVLMKGPLGFSEFPQFAYGTVEMLKEISRLTKQKKIFSVLGGGHLTTTILEYHLPSDFSYVSLSGGAMITYVAGEKLPGIVALEKSKL